MKDLLSSIFNIFRWVGKFLTTIRVLTLNIAFIGLLIFLFISFSSRSTTNDLTISNSGALILSLAGNIVEEKQASDPLSTMINDKLGFDNFPSETLFSRYS